MKSNQINDIITGDCIEKMSERPAASVDLVFADPPYNIGYSYDQYKDTLTADDYLAWCRRWIDGCVRLLKPDGSFYVLIGDEYAAEIRLYIKELETRGRLVFRNWIIWHYTFGQNCKSKFNRSHAHLLYCVGPDHKAATFNRDAIAVPSARQTDYKDKRANSGGKLPDDVWYLRPQTAAGVSDRGLAVDYFSPSEDTWFLSRVCGTFKERVGWHPCQLPESLLQRVIKVSSNVGDVVFDPFTGSGTTLAVAAALGRNWLGCELSEDYARRAFDRITTQGCA